MIPILIVSGFLGAGKTSLVRWLLAEAKRNAKRVAVISNEFGAIGIDQALLGAAGPAVAQLDGGCVCCRLSDELVGTLEMLRRSVNPDQIMLQRAVRDACWDVVMLAYNMMIPARIRAAALDRIPNPGDLLPSLKASAPDVPPEFWDEFMKEVDPNELVNLTVPIYMRHFTEHEIQEMIRFYRTPTGQKLVQKQPQVMQESMQAGQLWAQGLAQRVLERSMQSR